MKGKRRCAKCHKTFEWTRSAKQVIPKYCSMECRGHKGFKPGGEFRISKATKSEKLERLKQSFEKHVIRQEECWDWKGPLDKGGYSIMSCKRQLGSDRGHRASWIIYKGNIPKDKVVCHKCDNPICTNPEHLWLGTQKQNNDDKIKKGRAIYTKPPLKKGIENGASKLKEDQVKEIKELLKTDMSQSEIGKKFDVSKTTIYRIKHGKNWSHIEV